MDLQGSMRVFWLVSPAFESCVDGSDIRAQRRTDRFVSSVLSSVCIPTFEIGSGKSYR